MTYREQRSRTAVGDVDRRTRKLVRQSRRADDEVVRNRLRDEAIVLNMPLARAAAARFRSMGVEWEDLAQVSYLALTKAIDGYDPESPYRFSAYAAVTVRGEIKRWFRDHDWAVRPPRRYQELNAAIATCVPELAQQLGRAPESKEIAEAVGVAPSEVEATSVACTGRRSLSLAAPVREPGGTTLGDTLPDPGDDIDGLEWRICLRRAVAQLGPRSRLILRMRFENDATQAEIGRVLGVSQMHVSRLLAGLIRQLRDDLQVAV